MSNVQSKFQKYVILTPGDYDNLLRLKVEQKHLDDSEKEMISVLKENKLSPYQRLKKYQQILFKSLLKRSSVRSEMEAARLPLSPRGFPPSNIEKMKETPEKAPLKRVRWRKKALLSEDLDDSFRPWTALERPEVDYYAKELEDVAAAAAAEPQVNPFTGESVEKQSMTDFHTPAARVGESENNEEVFEDRGSPIYSSPSNAAMNRRLSDIYMNDLNQPDFEKEHNYYTSQIREQSSVDDPDISRMSFKYLDDPEKNYILVRDEENNDDMVIQKSNEFLEFQQTQSNLSPKKKKRMPSELDKLKPMKKSMKYPSPAKTKLRSGHKVAEGIRSRLHQGSAIWLSFENLL